MKENNKGQLNIKKLSNVKLNAAGIRSILTIVVPMIFYAVFSKKITSSLTGILNRIQDIRCRNTLTIPTYYEGGNEEIYWFLAFAILLFATFVMLISNLLETKERKGFFFTSEIAKLQKYVIKTVAFLLIFLICLQLNPSGFSLEKTRKNINNAQHAKKYESGMALPEGDFTKSEIFLQEGSFITVSSDKIYSMYLKGFVGAKFIENKWEEIEGELLLKEASLFKALYTKGFYPSAMLETFNEDNLHVLNINNINACKAYRYVPYELAKGLDYDLYTLNEQGYIKGAKQESYSAYIDEGAFENAYENFENNKESLDNEYLLLESNYRKFVYDNYLDVSEDDLKLIGSCIDLTKKNLTSYEARYYINRFFELYTKYKADAKYFDNNGKFLEAVLADGKEGNDVHYASAAVLMLRAFGIPARYVEGFAIRESDASGSSITLGKSNMHAWAEYYEDGLGWLPFEVSPSFKDDMTESKWQWFSQNSEGLKEKFDDSFKFLEDENNQKEDEKDKDKDNKDEKEDDKKLSYLKYIIAAVISLVLFFLIIIFVRRSLIKKKEKSAYDNAEINDKIALSFSKILRYLKASGIAIENIPFEKQFEGFDSRLLKASALNDEAIFSDHLLRDEDLIFMNSLSSEILNETKSKLKLKDRLYHTWISCYL